MRKAKVSYIPMAGSGACSGNTHKRLKELKP